MNTGALIRKAAAIFHDLGVESEVVRVTDYTIKFGTSSDEGNADCYWVGDAGPGPSYIEARGDRHLHTNRTVRSMVHNLAFMA